AVEEALEVVQGHVRVGVPREEAPEPGDQLDEGLGADGLGDLLEVVPGAGVVADAPGMEQRVGLVGGLQTVAALVEVAGPMRTGSRVPHPAEPGFRAVTVRDGMTKKKYGRERCTSASPCSRKARASSSV